MSTPNTQTQTQTATTQNSGYAIIKDDGRRLILPSSEVREHDCIESTHATRAEAESFWLKASSKLPERVD